MTEPIQITEDTDVTQFKVGQRVRLGLLPLSQYIWNGSDATPTLEMIDVAILARNNIDEGVITKINPELESWLTFYSFTTQEVHVWTTQNLRSIVVIGEATVRELPARTTIETLSRHESFKRVHYSPCNGGELRVGDACLIPWGFVRWLAGVLGVWPAVRLDADELMEDTRFERDCGALTVKVGCWPPISELEARKFLSWAMERAPEPQATQEN